jgi:two-component system sensor kinase
VGCGVADPPTADEPIDRQFFGGRFRATHLLRRALGVETYRGVDLDGTAMVIRTAPGALLSTAAHQWLRFEADTLGQLAHRAVAAPLHLGREGELLCSVRPFVHGPTLAAHRQAAPLSTREVVRLAIELLQVLAAVHARGLVHGDIKPSNVVLASGRVDAPVLVDFGLARHMFVHGNREDLPSESISYLAPEQAGLLARGIDGRADLYGLGLLMYEAIAGRPLFAGRTISKILRQQLTASPPPLTSLVSGVPRALERIIGGLLRKDPRDRYQTASGVSADLEELAGALERGQRDPDVVVGSRDARESLAEPAFTGRAAQLAALERALAAARAGEGGLVLLEGESGSGKTWLLEELRRRAVQDELWILRGQGLAGVAGRPFHVLSGVAHEIAASARAGSTRAAGLVARAGAVGGAICELLPELCPVFGDPAPAPPSPQAEAEQRSLAALSMLLDALGTEDDVALLLLDDGQWTDALTLALLEQWHQQRAGRRHVLVVAAFRAEEVGEAHPLRRMPAAQRVYLDRFGADEVRSQVASMAGQLPDKAVDLVLEHGAGNPFLVTAVLHGLVESGALTRVRGHWQLDDRAVAELQISGHIANLLAARIARLAPTARQLLAIGALLGRTFDPTFAGDLCGLPPETAVRVVKELRGSLLWIDRGGTSCTLLHDRIREALLGTLPDQDRRRLHLEVARRLEPTGADRAFEIAYHYDAAGAPALALPHALLAAERAQAQHDMELAERYYRIAARGTGEDGDRALRYRVARGLGHVLLVRSSYDECAEILAQAYRLAPDDHARADIEERRTQLALKQGKLQVAIEHGEHALRLIRRHVPRSRLVCALVVLWQLLVQILHTWLPRLLLGRRPAERAGDDMFAAGIYHSLNAPYFFARGAVWAIWAHLHDLNINERYPASAARGRAYGLHGAMCSAFPALFERAIRYTRSGAQLCAERGDLWGQARAVQFLSLSLCATGRYQEAVAAAEESAQLFERAGDTWEANGPLCWGALARYRMGDLADTLRAAQRLLERGQALDDAHGTAFALDALARASEGQMPDAVLDDELRRRGDHVQTSSVVAQAKAIVLIAGGSHAAAAQLLAQWLQRMQKEGVLFHDSNASLPVYHLEALRRQALALTLASLRQRAELLRQARRAARRALAVARKFRNCEPHALREAAWVAAMCGRPQRARRLVDRSVAAAERLGAPFELALSREARGALGIALGWPGAAEEQAAARHELRARRALLARPAPPVAVSLIERFRVMLEAGHRIVRSLTADAVFESLRDAAMVLLGAQRCSLIAAPGPADREVQIVHGDTGPVSRAMVTEALAAGHLVVRPTAGEPITADETLVRAAVRSALCVPVQVGESAAWLLYLTQSEVGAAFADEEQRIAEFLTTLAGAALENAERFLQIQEFSRALEERVATRTAELARANTELGDSLRRLQETQEQLLHAGRMAAVGILVAGLSHELNNPLTVIIGNLDNLRRLMPADERLQRTIHAIARHATRAADLVKALLDFSRTGPAVREEVAPGAIVRTVLELVRAEAETRKVELRVSLADDLPALAVSPREIESALVNITKNAVDATPAGGRVELQVAAARRGALPGICFAVCDTGEGIDPEVLPQIFDPFFTTKPAGQGTGLGLSLARQAVVAHGGQLDATSSRGAGTTMTLWLPLRSGAD